MPKNKKLAHMIRLALLSGLFMNVAVAHADQPAIDIGNVGVSDAAQGAASSADHTNPAAPVAPLQAPLSATQPTSVVSKAYIDNNIPLSGSFTDIVNLSPSVSSTSPNGPGLSETVQQQMRGFQDGQFNVTFDGIPWGDPNDFTHHSTSYFMTHDMGQASVDRGPGSASTIGNATFGGTMAMLSKDPSLTPGLNPYFSSGSWNTRTEGLEFDTGDMQNYHDARAFIDGEHMSSDGFLSYSGIRRDNAFAKIEDPVSANTTVTFALMENRLRQYVPLGATLSQIAQQYNRGLTNDPTKQSYYGYNYDDIHTDMAYVGFDSNLDNAWHLNDKIYTFGYDHQGQNGNDVTDTTANGTTLGAKDVPGQKMDNTYRSVGNLLKMDKDYASGTLRTGLWTDHQSNVRWQDEVDWTLGGALYTPSGNASPVDRYMNDTLDSVQPYVEYAWKATPRLTVTPGLKYAWFKRNLDAPVNQGTGKPLYYSKTWDAPLPSIDAHYRINPQWAAYAQAAKGFLAPNLNTLYTDNPGASDLKPQQSWNYQVGTVWKGNGTSIDADLFYINFNNMIGKTQVGADPNNIQFYNQGGVVYKGAEAEIAQYVGRGFSVAANGSVNSARTKSSHQWIAEAPNATAALGVLYHQADLDASIFDKFIGRRFGDKNESVPLGSYSTTNLGVTYRLPKNTFLGKAEVNFQVDNLFNHKGIMDYAGGTAGDGSNMYYVVPTRSYFVNLSTKF